jgi:hypothetical protein
MFHWGGTFHRAPEYRIEQQGQDWAVEALPLQFQENLDNSSGRRQDLGDAPEKSSFPEQELTKLAEMLGISSNRTFAVRCGREVYFHLFAYVGTFARSGCA